MLTVLKGRQESTQPHVLYQPKLPVNPPEKEETWADFKAADEKIASYDDAAKFSITCPFTHADNMLERIELYRTNPNHSSFKCKDCRPRNKVEWAVTDQNRYESAKAIAANLFCDTTMPDGTLVTAAMKQKHGKADNPWWQQCTPEERGMILTEFPEYANLVGLEHQYKWWQKMFEAVWTKKSEDIDSTPDEQIVPTEE